MSGANQPGGSPAPREIVELQGVRIAIDPAIMSDKIQRQIRNGKYERGEARNLPEIIEPGERLLELGGGIGFLSALAALQRRAEVIVVIEANPELIPVIRETHRLNGVTAQVLNAAVVGVRSSPWSRSQPTVPDYRDSAEGFTPTRCIRAKQVWCPRIHPAPAPAPRRPSHRPSRRDARGR